MTTRRTFLANTLKAGAFATALRSPLFAAEIPPAPAAPLALFHYHDVTLDPGLAQSQFEQTQSVLMSLDEDALLAPWRMRAGLPAPGPRLGGWYDEILLRKPDGGGEGFAPGHAFGQWISALSRGYAITGDPARKARVQRLLDLYSQAISEKFFTNFRFPAYDYDKMVIALIDAHEFAQIPSAFALLDRTTAAVEPHLPPTAIDRDDVMRRWRASVGDNTTDDYTWDEPYTLAENLYLAAQRGAGDKYRVMARRFLLDPTWNDPLSRNENVLNGHHAYSFCNSLSSAMQAYLSDNSQKHLAAAKNGFAMIHAQSYATGAWGPDESFRTPGTGALLASLTNTHHHFETPCGSYGHFKLTRYLLRVTRDGRYGDSMERIFYNTVLGALPLQSDGRAFYYSDYSPAATKFYHDDKFPCCAGTLPQVTADYRISTYLKDDDGIWVNLYLPSSVTWTNWDGDQLLLRQSHNYPIDGNLRFEVQAGKGTRALLRLRIPAWAQGTSPTVEVRINKAPTRLVVQNGFVTIDRHWGKSDKIELTLPLPLRLEAIEPEHPNTVAIVRGPLVLFALGAQAPAVTRDQLLAAQPVPKSPIPEWQIQSASGPIRLRPFFHIHDEHYTTYHSV